MSMRARQGKRWLAAYGAVIAVAACSLNPQPLPPEPDPDEDERVDAGASFGEAENPAANDDGKQQDASPAPEGDGGGDAGDGGSDAGAD